jgi:Tol biopolymer transport system component/DNA-binding winged helix-turn-helix (wHTH) protein
MVNAQVKLSYEFGPFRLDPSERRLARDGRTVALTPKAFEVLRLLVEHAGHLVEKDTLVAEVWPDNFVEEGALNRNVSLIRKALGETAEQKYVETVPKHGYRFVAAVITCDTNRLRTLSESEPRRLDGFVPVWLRRLVSTFGVSSAHIAGTRIGAILVAIFLALVAVTATVLFRERNGEPAVRRELSVLHRQITFTGKEGAPTLSPDGKRIAYVSNATPDRNVIVQELAGGSPLEIFAAPEVGHLRWSPDGSELLVWARGRGRNGVYIISQMGGTPRLIAPGMYIACWSPDGSTIAVPSYLGGKIWFVNTQGTRQRTLSLQSVDWSIWDIDWSPGGLLTFTTSNTQGRFTLWTVRPDGSDQTQVLTEPSGIYSARWAPGGDAIYYLRQLNQTDSLSKVRIQPSRAATGVDATTILTGIETDQSFAISSDGHRLVYARAPYHSNLWALDVDTEGRIVTRQLTYGTSLIERPHISPDGRSIAFNMGHEPTANIYTMPVSGGSLRQLTFFNSFNMAGGWSEDGKSIAFASTENGAPRVWTVSAESGTLHPLSSGEMSDNFNVTWFPRRTILYQQAGNRNYRELDPNTAQEERLVANSTVGWMFSPAPAPDGRRVAVMWNRPPNRGVWVIDTIDHSERWIYKSEAAWTAPIGWSPDGRSIYTVEGKTRAARGLTSPFGETLTEARIVRIPLSGDPQTIAMLPAQETGGVSMTADARRFVFTVYSSQSDVWVVDNFDNGPAKQFSRKE